MINYLYAILSCESLLVMLLFKNLLTSVDPIPGTSFCRSTFPLAKALPKVKTFFCFSKEYLMLAQKAGYIVLVPCTYLKILNFSPESTISCPPSSATCNGSKRYKSKCRSFKLSIWADPVDLLIRTKLNSINHWSRTWIRKLCMDVVDLSNYLTCELNFDCIENFQKLPQFSSPKNSTCDKRVSQNKGCQKNNTCFGK